jgi:hypothetical protein
LAFSAAGPVSAAARAALALTRQSMLADGPKTVFCTLLIISIKDFH